MNDDTKVKGLLCYAVFPLSSLIVYLVEKDADRFVRFHAIQGVIAGVALWVIYWILSAILAHIPFIGWLFGLALSLGFAAIWIMCMVRAYRGEEFRLPVIGDIAANVADKR